MVVYKSTIVMEIQLDVSHVSVSAGSLGERSQWFSKMCLLGI